MELRRANYKQKSQFNAADVSVWREWKAKMLWNRGQREPGIKHMVQFLDGYRPGCPCPTSRLPTSFSVERELMTIYRRMLQLRRRREEQQVELRKQKVRSAFSQPSRPLRAVANQK